LKAPVEQFVAPDLDMAGTEYGQPEFVMLDDSDVDVAPDGCAVRQPGITDICQATWNCGTA
jgi:hypothetical protein